MERLFLSDMTPHLLREKLTSAPVAYLPLGAIEEVGTHLPLGAGAFYVQGLLNAVAREVGGVVLPTLFFTPSEEMTSSPMALTAPVFTLPVKVFEEMVECLLRSLPRYGVKVVAAHGVRSSQKILEQNRPCWEERYNLRIITLEPFTVDELDGSEPPLAVGMDTSLMMAICPDLVELHYLSSDREEWPVGVSGSDPRSRVYAERGERILDRQVNQMAALIRECLQDPCVIP